MPQFFKGDDLELKISGSVRQVFTVLLNDLTAWFNNAYDNAGLGAVIYDNNLVPLTKSVARDVFIQNYGEILRQWEYVGSFESYLKVFMYIFGPKTSITFERLKPGALKIYIQTDQSGFIQWISQLKNKMVTQSGYRLVFAGVLGIKDFYEVQGVLDSLNPAGIFLDVDFQLIIEE